MTNSRAALKARAEAAFRKAPKIARNDAQEKDVSASPNDESMSLSRPVETTEGAMEEYLARSKPDGYTVLINSGEAMAANMYILKKPPVDVLSALTLVSTTNSGALLIVVPGNSPAKSIADLTALLKAKT
jgi:hypothetical protein